MSAGARPAISLKSVPVEQVKQVNTYLCWAACCEVMARYHKCPIIDQFQLAVARRVFHTDEPEKLNQTADDTQVVQALKVMLPTVKSVRYAGSSTARFSHSAVEKFVDAGRIMIVGFRNHARVLCGYGTYDGKEGISTLDPAVGRVTFSEWHEFDDCVWVVYVPK